MCFSYCVICSILKWKLNKLPAKHSHGKQYVIQATENMGSPHSTESKLLLQKVFCLILAFLFLFLVALHGLWDLSSQTWDCTRGPWQWKLRVLIGLPGNSLIRDFQHQKELWIFVLPKWGKKKSKRKNSLTKGLI